jgi:regulatory protein
MSEDLYRNIYNKALDIISRREHSSKEVRDKLARKFNSDDLIESAIENLITNNLINDIRFAEMYVLSRKKKGFGPKRIAYELSSKGVKDSLSNEAIINEGGWLESAQIVFAKKFKEGPSSDFKESMKQKTFMQNRGFSFKEIDSVMQQDML